MIRDDIFNTIKYAIWGTGKASVDQQVFDEMKKHSEKGGEMINNIFSNLDDESFFKTAVFNFSLAHFAEYFATSVTSSA